MLNKLREIIERLTGRDRIRESYRALYATEREMDRERIRRVEVLEKNARDAAQNFRAASLFDAALVEREKADALAERKRSLQRKRDKAEAAHLRVVRRDYGLRNGSS